MVSSSCPIDQEDTKALVPAQSWAGVPGALESGVWPSVSGGLGVWLSRWTWGFCWLLSRHCFGLNRSSCRAGALGQKMFYCLERLLCSCEALSDALYCRTKQASGADWGVEEGDFMVVLFMVAGFFPNHTVLYFIDLYRSVEMSHKWLAEPSSVVLCLHHCFYIKWPHPLCWGVPGAGFMSISVFVMSLTQEVVHWSRYQLFVVVLTKRIL